MEVEDAEETTRPRDDMLTTGVMDSQDGPNSEAPALSSEGDDAANGPKILLLAWNTAVNVLADAEPATAAGVAGLFVILVLVIFGRIGSLLVGILGGLLLHASFEKKRGGIGIPWSQRFASDQVSDEKIAPREVCEL